MQFDHTLDPGPLTVDVHLLNARVDHLLLDVLRPDRLGRDPDDLEEYQARIFCELPDEGCCVHHALPPARVVFPNAKHAGGDSSLSTARQGAHVPINSIPDYRCWTIVCLWGNSRRAALTDRTQLSSPWTLV